MVLWRRLPLETVDVIGDQTVAAQLVSVPDLTYSLCRRTAETR